MEKYFKIVSFIVYLISFFMPVFVGDDSMGYLAFLAGLTSYPLPWSANVFYIISLSLKKRLWVERLVCSFLAIALACTTFSIHEIDGIGSESEPVKVSVGIGFYFWFGSFFILLVGIFLGKRSNKDAVRDTHRIT